MMSPIITPAGSKPRDGWSAATIARAATERKETWNTDAVHTDTSLHDDIVRRVAESMADEWRLVDEAAFERRLHQLFPDWEDEYIRVRMRAVFQPVRRLSDM